ncbi:MAG TPA: hypothetical protein VFR34_04840 [Paracoccaceae bacterium]|nr:hypothetical protein [Paracoccaceae bacterium]
MTAELSEERIAALVDGALEPEEAAEIARLIAADPAAQAYEAQLRRTNAILGMAFDAPMSEPVPAAIEAVVRGGPRVVPFVQRPPRRWQPAALAAGIVLGLGAGWLLHGTGEAPGGLSVLGTPPARLAVVLESHASGEPSPEGIELMLTFRDGSGRPCREFEMPGAMAGALAIGLACRAEPGEWEVEILVQSAPQDAPTTEYRPAGGPGEDAIGAMLDSLGIGEPLSPGEEARLIANGWR